LHDEFFLDRDQPGTLELREMARQVSLRQAGQPLQEEEVGASARVERGEDCQPRRLVDDAVQLRKTLERNRHQRSAERPSTRTSPRWSRIPPTMYTRPTTATSRVMPLFPVGAAPISGSKPR